MRVLAIVLRQFYLVRGSTSRIVPMFAWVAMDMILWGLITRYLNVVSNSHMNFVPTLLGAVLLWDFFSRVMAGVTMAFFEDVWSRNFLNVFATPMRIGEYIAGLVLSSICTSSIALTVMLVLATALFGLSFFSYGVMVIPFLLVLFVFGIALGVIGSGIVLRLGPASEWFVWPIPAVVTPFVGVYYPVATLPHPLQYFAHVLPPSYVFEGLRGVIAGHSVSGASLAFGAALAIGYLLLACWFFFRMYRHAVRSGLIARYSAETVS